MEAKNLSTKYCKVCGLELFNQPLISYQNMPKVAQHLPTVDSVQNDSGIDLDVYQCSACGLIQLNIEPVPYFREVIRAVGVSKDMMEFRAKQFQKFVDEYNLKGKKIIEVGSGSGEYLSLVKQAGAKAFGLEFGQASVEESLKKGLDVTKGFVENEDYKINNAPFDAFVILSFFEHLPKPNTVLRGIYNNLADGGIGMVEVPNFDMILREKLFSEFMTDHLFYFTKQTLKTTLELNGFEVLEETEVWHNYILSAVVRKVPNFTPRAFSGAADQTDLSSFAAIKNKIQTELNNYLSRFKQVAIWGAGHQAFAIMAMMGLGGKIKYVVDSAPFKQGKFTPASHIPIVAPESLNSDPVDAIIIMAGSYSEEIKKTVKEKYNKNINIAVLRESGLKEV